MTDGRWQNARIIRILQQTPRIKSFFLEMAVPFDFRPGQHVDLRLTAPDGYEAMRSYSIASAPDGTAVIELAIEQLDDGEVSSFFHEVAMVGDEIEVRGPLGGHFVWRPQDGGPVLLIGGGSGIVPLMCIIRTWRAEASQLPVVLLLSARSSTEALYREELFKLDAEASGLSVRLALTRELPMREVDYGRRIDAAMVSDVVQLAPVQPLHVFICGSNAFANAAADSVEAAGIGAERIRTERYGG